VNCSKLFSLYKSDFFQGLLMAIGSSVFDAIYQLWVVKSTFGFDFTELWHVAAVAALVYLGKNFFRGTNGNMLTNK
jgi:hypothetical protein